MARKSVSETLKDGVESLAVELGVADPDKAQADKADHDVGVRREATLKPEPPTSRRTR